MLLRHHEVTVTPSYVSGIQCSGTSLTTGVYIHIPVFRFLPVPDLPPNCLLDRHLSDLAAVVWISSFQCCWPVYVATPQLYPTDVSAALDLVLFPILLFLLSTPISHFFPSPSPYTQGVREIKSSPLSSLQSLFQLLYTLQMNKDHPVFVLPAYFI